MVGGAQRSAAGGARPQPTRILLLCDYGGPYAGSFVPMLRAIVAEARRRDYEAECAFTPIARDRPWLQELTDDGIEVRFPGAADARALREWLEARLAELSGPALIHTHFTAFELPAVAVASSSGGVPVLWHIHSHQPGRAWLVARAVVKYGWYSRRVESIVCVSEAIASAVRRRGAPRGKVVVVANGIDLERFPALGAEERAGARARLDLERRELVLLHVGWDWEAKGGPLFADALAALRAAGIDAAGVSVGGGARAQEAAAALGLGTSLTAVEATADVRSLYAVADALVATSHGEGAPFAILEALACGLAVVAGDVPGHRLAPQPPAALRLAPAEPASLARALIAVAERTPEIREAEARAAHQWVAANRALTETARRIVDLYQRALEGPARGQR